MFLALLGVAAARPQLLYPNQPIITYKAAEGAIQTPFPYTFPTTYGSYPFSYNTFPYSYNHGYPLLTPTVAHPAATTDVISRPKRSADAEPEPEADPHTVYSGLTTYPIAGTTYPIAGTTTYNHPTTYPFVSTYGAFPNVPFAYNYPGVSWSYPNVVKTV